MQVGLTIGAPFLAAVVSGLFVAPASGMRLAGPPRLLLQVAVFGSAVVVNLAVDLGLSVLLFRDFTV